MSAPCPELNGHLREIERGNRLEVEDERFDELVLLCDAVASHSVSAREAAWRRDRVLLDTHLRHAREGLVLALRTFNNSLLPAGGKPS